MKSLIASIFIVWIFLARVVPGQSSFDKTEIRKILESVVDKQKRSVGIAVGVIDETGKDILCYGKTKKDGKEIDANTVFEIGSVTKVFTTTLLAQMVENGEVKLDDPAVKFLPSSVTLPSRNGRQITLLDLATHTSGLPHLPGNLDAVKHPENPYLDYTVNQLYDFLARYHLAVSPGEKFEYSNLGMGLLGHLLALRADSNYERLIGARICQPLQMDETSIHLTNEQQSQLAAGHDLSLHPVKNWDIPTIEGAGALRSTTTDLLKFVEANLDLAPPRLASAMRLAHQPRRLIGEDETISESIGLGWTTRRFKKLNREIVWKGGQTGGYTAFVGFEESKRRGVVLLINAGDESINDVFFHLLVEESPLTGRSIVRLDPKTYDIYVGRYDFDGGIFAEVVREGDRLFYQATVGETKGPKLELFPASKTEFFMKGMDAQVIFYLKNETAESLDLILGGEKQTAKRNR